MVVNKNTNYLLKELVDIEVDLKKSLKKSPGYKIDMEPYENTPTEDLINSSYLSGKLEMIEEFKELLEEYI